MAAVLIVLVMIAIKDGRLLREAGLTGGCHTVATPKGQAGRLAGLRPRQAARRTGPHASELHFGGLDGKTEYWRCPAGIEGGPG